MSSFSAGFAARHDAAAQALHQAFSQGEEGFAPADLKARASGRAGDSGGRGPKTYAPQAARPRHFSPADPSQDPTEGWDPLNPDVDQPTQGFVDPVANAHASGFAEGVAHALELHAQNGERDAALLANIVAALGDANRIDRERIARQLRQTVLFLVSKLVGEIGVAGDLLAGRIEAAADMLADSAESALLRVHPDDVALLADRLPGTIFPVGDVSVARGGFVLESASTIVEDGPDLWLEQLAQAIDRIAVPALQA